jgi:hypothetical protein
MSGIAHGRMVDRSRERLIPTDVPVITARQILLDLAKALEDGIEPAQAADGDLYRVRAIAAVSEHPELGGREPEAGRDVKPAIHTAISASVTKACSRKLVLIILR